MFEKISLVSDSILTAIGTATVGFFLWLIRTLLTNQKQIEMLGKEIEHRDELRKSDSERIARLHEDVRELRERLLKE